MASVVVPGAIEVRAAVADGTMAVCDVLPPPLFVTITVVVEKAVVLVVVLKATVVVPSFVLVFAVVWGEDELVISPLPTPLLVVVCS